MSNKSNEINTFWDWFKTNENFIFQNYDKDNIWDFIDEKLMEVNPLLTWEIGPVSDSQKLYFAVSPDFHEELIDISKDIISRAYLSFKWDFKVGKQPKDETFLYYSNKFIETEIDFSKWKFSLKKNNNLFDVLILLNNFTNIDLDTLDTICHLVVIQILGELSYYSLINDIYHIRNAKKEVQINMLNSNDFRKRLIDY